MKCYVKKGDLWLRIIPGTDRMQWTNDKTLATVFEDEAVAGWWQERLRGEIEIEKEAG